MLAAKPDQHFHAAAETRAVDLGRRRQAEICSFYHRCGFVAVEPADRLDNDRDAWCSQAAGLRQLGRLTSLICRSAAVHHD